MATNLTIEAPNFDKINKEAGQFTSDAMTLLWAALNLTRDEERRDFRRSREILAPKVRVSAPAASVNNLDLEGSSILHFNGGSAQDFTGARAPETGEARILVVLVTGAGTITVKHNATSETANQIVCSSGADTTLATNAGMILVYLASKWRQVV